MKYRITTWLAAALMLSSLHATAASLSDIQVSNGDQQARITLSFVGEPEYSFTPQGKRLVALDIKQTGVLQGLPLQFSGSNLVKSIRAGTPQDTQTLRLLVDRSMNTPRWVSIALSFPAIRIWKRRTGSESCCSPCLTSRCRPSRSRKTCACRGKRSPTSLFRVK